MNVRILLLGTAAALSLAAGGQAAPFHGWYVSVEGGADWVQDSDFVNHFAGKASFADRYNYNTGWAALASLGYSFNSHWRVEGEVGYRSNDIDQMIFAGNSFNVNGTLKEVTLMANAVYDIPLTEKLDLSIGAGLGADDAMLKSNVPANGFSDNQWKFAYQGIAGLNYQIGKRSQLFLNYRYLSVEAPTFTHGVNEFDFDNLHKHTVTIGLRFDLQADEEPAPPPPPPPPPEVGPTQFVIFFAFNKCNITSEADSVLSEAAASAKEHGSASVEIVGHTDTVGSAKYNQKLSECRAHAAAKNLEGKGVPAGAIQTSGKGEHDLLIQTGDGVKEPQNRRDTITLH